MYLLSETIKKQHSFLQHEIVVCFRVSEIITITMMCIISCWRQFALRLSMNTRDELIKLGTSLGFKHNSENLII